VYRRDPRLAPPSAASSIFPRLTVTSVPFPHIHPLLLIAGTLAGAGAMIAWRLRETRAPVTLPKIVAPPLGMSTGLSMFAAPAFRVPWTWAAASLLAGALLLAIPLARTSNLVRRGEEIMVERSRAFLWILLALVAVRLGLRAWVEEYVTQAQSGALLFLLAFGAIVRWRTGMLRAYLRLRA
jgi:membrane protein CcdC involved in cytochrome C biogenesis